MAEIKLQKRVKYAGDVHLALMNAGVDSVSAFLLLESVPDADAEPVKHGRWTPIAETHWRWLHDGAHPVTRIKYKHDECGKIVTKKENYCPNCGAYMKEGE